MRKPVMISMLMWLVASTSFSQSEEYMKVVESKVVLLDSNNSVDTWIELANTFERIGETEKTEWLPYYYAAFCQVMAGYSSMPPEGNKGDYTEITDPYAEKAEQLMNKALTLTKENSEILCVMNMIYTLRMIGKPMMRFMTDGAKAEKALKKARNLYPNNPRVYILEGQDKFHTPELFGGSKA